MVHFFVQLRTSCCWSTGESSISTCNLKNFSVAWTCLCELQWILSLKWVNDFVTAYGDILIFRALGCPARLTEQTFELWVLAV